jgi:RNA methyltransferase, TrmH family
MSAKLSAPSSTPNERHRMSPSRFIVSAQNSTVKLIRSLNLPKVRRRTGLFVAEGTKVVATAREGDWAPQIIIAEQQAAGSGMVRTLVEWAMKRGAHDFTAPAQLLSKLSTRDNPQKVIAVFEQRWTETRSISAGGADVWIALEEIRDPGNLGTIIRTADAVGARGIILIGQCCDPYSREAIRATMGSIFNATLVRMQRHVFLEWLQTWPGQVVGTHLTKGSDFRRAYEGPVVLVLGSEGPGLTEEIAAACTRLIKIPMLGRADSLNLAVAAALALYEIRRSQLPLLA